MTINAVKGHMPSANMGQRPPGTSIRDETDLVAVFAQLRSRYMDRDQRHREISRVLRREWNLTDSNGDPLLIASANMVKTAMEDISEAAATMPALRVRAAKQTAGAIEEASKMEKIALGYAAANKLNTRMPRFIMDHLAYGFTPFVVLPDSDTNQPRIFKRDPRTTFPEMPIYPSMIPRRVMFSERVPFASLSEMERDYVEASGFLADTTYKKAPMLVKLEYVTPDEYIIGFMYSTNRVPDDTTDGYVTASWTPVITKRVKLKAGVTPVVIVARDTFDDQHRGLFDDVLDPQLAHAKLMAMAIDYADQAVYSDTWARDVMGDTAYGGGSFIELGPNGAIGRVPPAASSLDLWRDLDKIEESIHLGARYPKSRPGQVDQSIASGKFVEATIGTMNTVLKVVHEKFAEGIEDLMQLCYATDLGYFPNISNEARGVQAGQDFICDYIPKADINLDHTINAEYGMGLGRDPQESAVMMLQYAEKGLLSEEFVMENTEGLRDVQRELQRVDLEKVSKMMFAALLKSVEEGEIPKQVLADVYERREKGESMAEILADIYEPEPEVDPEDEIGPDGLPMGPEGMMPGLPGGQPPMPPPPPEVAALMGGIPGGVPGAQPPMPGGGASPAGLPAGVPVGG